MCILDYYLEAVLQLRSCSSSMRSLGLAPASHVGQWCHEGLCSVATPNHILPIRTQQASGEPLPFSDHSPDRCLTWRQDEESQSLSHRHVQHLQGSLKETLRVQIRACVCFTSLFSHRHKRQFVERDKVNEIVFFFSVCLDVTDKNTFPVPVFHCRISHSAPKQKHERKPQKSKISIKRTSMLQQFIASPQSEMLQWVQDDNWKRANDPRFSPSCDFLQESHMSAHTLSHCLHYPLSGTEGHHIYFWIQTLHHRSPEPSHKPCSPTPLSSTPGLLTQRSACSIFPSRVTAGLVGLMLATARLVLDCRVSSAAPICLAKARASGLSPLPLRRERRLGEHFNIGQWKSNGVEYEFNND